MMRWLVCSLTLVSNLLSLPGVAYACDTVMTASSDSKCVVMPYADQNGVWFRLETADELRKLKLEAPELRLQVALLEERARVRDWQLNRYRDVLKLKDGSIKSLENGLQSAIKAEREAKASLDAWYRQPALWLVTGLVAGLATVVVLDR